MDRLGTYQMFNAVAEQASFSGAARHLRISPPALSRGIAELEARLGVSRANLPVARAFIEAMKQRGREARLD